MEIEKKEPAKKMRVAIIDPYYGDGEIYEIDRDLYEDALNKKDVWLIRKHGKLIGNFDDSIAG